MSTTFPGSRRSRVRGATVALAAAAALLASAAPAFAHDELVSSSPAANATVAQPPTEVVLTFDEAVLPVGTQVLVTGPGGPASDGAPSLSGKEVHQPLKGGPAGKYTVAWRATSADGHPVSGTFDFTAQAASPPSTTTTTPPPTSSTTTPPPSTTSSSSSTAPATSTTSVTAAPVAGSTSSFPWLAVVIVVVVAALGLGGWLWYRRRAATGPGTT